MGGYRWQEQLQGMTTIMSWEGQRTKEATPQREAVTYFIIQPHFPSIIKPLINSPVHREITQGLGAEQAIVSLQVGQVLVSLPAFVFSFSPFLLLIVSLGPAARWDASPHSVYSLSEGNQIFTLFPVECCCLEIVHHCWRRPHSWIVFEPVLSSNSTALSGAAQQISY